MLVEAVALAPSAKNRQPWKYIVYTGKKRQVALGNGRRT
ncbi:MAG: nitroreductase family protein [Butyrivibrio sp.]|nr:nitroreductase family protein [Butyrivibrio sp.]